MSARNGLVNHIRQNIFDVQQNNKGVEQLEGVHFNFGMNYPFKFNIKKCWCTKILTIKKKNQL